jgi:hypothetical protein
VIFYGAAVLALLALLNPAVAWSGRDAMALVAAVGGLYVVIAAAAAFAGAGAGWILGAAAIWLQRRGIGLAAFAALALVAVGAVFRENATLFRLCVPAAAHTALVVYGYAASAAGALALVAVAALGRRFAGGPGRYLWLAAIPLLLCALPVARRAGEEPVTLYEKPVVRRADTGFNVCVVGIDGLDADVVVPLAEAGLAPNFARLINEGASGELAAVPPALPPPAWTTVATGCYPAAHGVTGSECLKIRGVSTPLRVWPEGTLLSLLAKVGLAERRPFAGTDRRVPALWDVSSEAGSATTVLCWPATRPPEAVRGVVVPDVDPLDNAWGVLGIVPTYPPGLAAALGLSEYTPHELYDEARARLLAAGASPADDESFYRDYARGRTEENASLPVLENFGADLAMAYFSPVDGFQRTYWGYRSDAAAGGGPWGDVVARANAWADDYVGRVVERLGDDTVVIVVSAYGCEKASPSQRLYASLWQRRRVTGVRDVPTPPPGFAMLAGGPVKKGYVLRNASVVDVAANVLYLLGIPVADDMAGQVWRDAYEPSFLKRFPPRRVRSYRGLRVRREGPTPRGAGPPAAQ